MSFLGLSFLEFLVDHTVEQDTSTAVAYLDALVSDARATVSYTGERTFVHDRFEGSASLDQLARAYVQKGHFSESTSLLVRLQHDAVGRNLQRLYRQSDRVVARACLAGCFTAAREYHLNGERRVGVMAAVIGSDIHRHCGTFNFSEAQFRHIWPYVAPEGKDYHYDRASKSIRVTRDMVYQAARRQQHSQSLLAPVRHMLPQERFGALPPLADMVLL